jgi:peptidoglycan/LPS O-acetylase OafA/YrhL
VSRPATILAPPRSQRSQLNRVPYLPGLDGLRAVAVVAVMLYHANHEWLGGGFLGVEVFFVISGYLITLLLISEDARKGFIDLKQFWLRRARRLLPPLVLVLLGLSVYMALFERNPMGRSRGDFVAGLLYGSNWYQVYVGQGYTAAGAFAPLRHLWSLAVEEQFYLLWPLIMLVILRRARRRLPQVGLWLFGFSLAIAALVGILYRSGDVASTCGSGANGYWHLFGRCISANDALYLSTITRSGGIMLGAGLAMLWRPGAIMRGPLRDRSRQLDLVGLAGLALVVLLMWKVSLTEPGVNFGIRYDPWLFRGGFLWIGIATLMVIVAVTHQASLLGRFLGTPVFNWVGTRSYGLYLYHWPIYQIIRTYAGVGLTFGQFVLAMAITLPITELSYRYVETPIRKGRLGEWWRGRRDIRPSRPPSPLESRRPIYALGVAAFALVGFSVFSIATAQNKCVGDVECTLVQADASTTSDATATSAPATTFAGAVVDPPTTLEATTTTAPPPPPAMRAFGESVMLGAKKEIEAGGMVVDAAEDRQADKMVAEIQAKAAAGQIGATVVVQVGTNGTVTPGQLDQIVAAVPQGTTLWLMTVKAPTAWNESNNAEIRAVPGRHPAVGIIDWEAQSAQIVDELSPSDGGVHLRTKKAMQFYANMIFNGIGRGDLVQPLE